MVHVDGQTHDKYNLELFFLKPFSLDLKGNFKQLSRHHVVIGFGLHVNRRHTINSISYHCIMVTIIITTQKTT